MKYKTCVVIAEKNPKKLSTVVKNALKKSDFAEIRFDFLKPKDVPVALELIKKQLTNCVCTLRPKNEGGKFVGSENERKSIIKLIAEYSPFLLDIEFNALQKDKKFLNDVKNSTHIVLPGQGAFSTCMNGLKKTDGLIDELCEFALIKKKPFLGICVGMQMLANISEENGDHEGLGWIDCQIKILPGDNLKLPHMGWNLAIPTNSKYKNLISNKKLIVFNF